MSEKDCGFERPAAVTEAQEKHLKAFPYCECCKPGTNLQYGKQAHHVIPFHYCIALGRAYAASDPRNFITLCETEKNDPADNHHLLVGHYGNFKEGNLNVMEDAKLTYFAFSKGAIEASAIYQNQVKTRKLRALDLMTDAQKTLLVAIIDKWFPQDKPDFIPDYKLSAAEYAALAA